MRISTDESSGSSSDDSDFEGQKHDTHMDDATTLIKEVGVKSTSTPAEEVLKLSRLAMGFSSDELSSSSDDSDFQGQEDDIHVVDTKQLINDAGVTSTTMPTEEVDNFTRLASMPLFPKSESSTLATLVLLLFLKVLHGWTEASFTDLLRLLADKILPKDNKMPRSHSEVSLAMKGSGHEMDFETLLRLFAHKLTSERDQVFTMMLQMSLTDPNKPAPSMPLMQLVQQHLATPQHPPISSDKGKGPMSETPKPSTNIWRKMHKLRKELEHIPDTKQRDMLIEVIQGMEEDVRLVEAQLMQSEHATPATDEQVITATPPASTIGTRATRTLDETPKTPITYEVTTRGKREVTLLLSNDGKVFKDEAGKGFFQYIHNRAEEIFGNYIENDWRKQDNKLKEQIYSDVVAEFGNPGYSYAFIMDSVCRHLHAKRDRLRLQLTKDLGSPRPTWITNMTTWDDLIKDAKFKKDIDKNLNHTPLAQEHGKRRLKDTSKATQARLLRIGSHKLGPCGYSSIQGTLIRQFGKAVSEKDLKYALKHGVQGLRQQMLERGEKFSTSHGTNEEAQQSHSIEAVDNGCEESPEISAACDELASARHESSGKDERQGHNGGDEHVASSCKRETRQNKKRRKNRN